jgi:hypothetical protein
MAVHPITGNVEYSPYPSYSRKAFSDIVVGAEEDGAIYG